ncbi:uncharacterized protein LOC127716654 isoform X4 [Mytilus californianus]|uniref:uncharacterized protein LOC127716654 isoform X4 n=1 Tax=Mytilus californianus TaxID=6549 RepID=UPI002245FCC7|nr:uncharacterized protein LOC127716654 isoform X4 [Mytilus californianus]
MAQASSSKCNLCGLINGVYFCYECKTAICKPCKTIHSNIPASRNHSITDLNQVDRAAYTFLSECKTHKQEFSLYCSDCECLICSKCVTSLHNNHKFCDVENAVKEARKSAGLQVVKLKETMQSSSTIIKEIEEIHIPELQKRQKQTQSITANVTSIMKEAQQIINSKGKIKITEYEDDQSIETERTRRDLANMRQNYKKQAEACSILDNLLREKHGMTFLSAYQILKCDIENGSMTTPNIMKPYQPSAFHEQRFTEDIIQSLCTQFKIRLNDVASRQKADGTFTERDDQNEPIRLGQRFSEVFEDTWSNAYEVLKPKKTESKKEDEKEEMDEKTIDILQNVVKVIYEFCKKTADSQVNKLMMEMLPPIFDPMNTKKECKGDDETVAKTEKMAKDYRKAVAPATIPILKQNILTQELQCKVLPDISIGKELKEYVDNCVNLIWYMCIQQPPMEIVWGKRGEKFNKEMFRFSGKKGTKFRLTVWPAVLFHKEGPLAAPGYAVPE